ncbi:hypothetical protein HY251_02620 [bacterium]|nr:hypothetical protein [bacterium]
MPRSFVNAARAVALASTLVFLGCPDQPTPPPATTNAPPAATNARAPIVPRVEVADWCKEHGVPESICTRCNETLIPEFKKKGDWCAKHELPDSQCLVCHPELKAKLEAMAPKEEKK